MLEHLIDHEDIVPSVGPADPKDFPALDTMPPADIVDAQVTTADIIALLDDEDASPVSDLQRDAAARAFLDLTNGTSLDETRSKLMKIKVPKAVRHLVGMLTAYEWEFVEQAKELRGYAVAKILEETRHYDAKVRLRALEMLGKVTEVALFTDKVEVKNTQLTDAELDAKLREKLQGFINARNAVAGPSEAIEDVTPKEIP